MKLHNVLKIILFLIVIVITISLTIGCTPDVESLKDKGNVKGLVKALNYKSDINISVGAAEALGEIGDKQAIGPLIEVLNTDRYGATALSAAAASALGKIGQPAVEPLMEELKGSVGSRWITVKDALVQIGGPSIEPLIELLNNKDSELRRRAALALGEIGDTRAIDALLLALNDEASNVREYAFKAIGSIGDEKTVEPLIGFLYSDDRKTQNLAAEALVTTGELSIEPLVKLLNEGDDGVINILINIGDARAIKPLIDFLDKYGDKGIAEIYLNCGNSELEKAAFEWADRNGYIVKKEPGGGGPSWDSGK